MRALALAALLAAPARATRPLTPPAPEFPPNRAWLNAKPLTMSLMRGRKVVLVAFLDPSSLHSVREIAVLKAWFDRYALNQLMIVGVVTPTLQIQRNVVWLNGQLQRLGVDFPVIVDNDRKVWKAYANDGWPALYLVDRRGRIVFDRLGEGDYEAFEGELRAALAELVGSGSLPPAVAPPEPPARDCGRSTPDVIMGSRAKAKAVAVVASLGRHDPTIAETRQGEIASSGAWTMTVDGLVLARDNRSQDAFVRVVYRAAQVLGVLAPPAGGRTRFFVKRDDQWLHEGDAGRDVRFDDDGRSYVDADWPRIYDLVHDSVDQLHEVYVIPERRGAGVYGFSFADSCLVTTLP